MKIENINNRYLKLSSEALENALKSKDQLGLIEIDAYFGCSGVNYRENIDFKLSNPCAFFSDNVIWKFDLSMAKNIDLSVTEISIINVASSEVFPLSVNINFAQYLASCPSGCTLQSLQPLYDNIFRNAYKSLINSLGLDDSKLDLKICGDTINLVGLPSGFSAHSIKLSNGVEAFYTQNDSEKSVVTNDSIYLNPKFFGMTTFLDGVYTLRVKITDSRGSYIEEQNCFFMDIYTKCKVSQRAVIALQLPDDKFVQDSVFNMYLLYNHLTTGSNCGGCNCEDMCDAYNKLIGVLTGKKLTEALNSKCGCQ